MKNDRVKLIRETITQDADGFDVITKSTSMVWGEIKSVKMSEFYMASNANTKVTDIVALNFLDYQAFKSKYGKPNKMVIDGEEFEIIRPYYDKAKKPNTIEITVVGVEE